jgi:hypothetical protein
MLLLNMVIDRSDLIYICYYSEELLIILFYSNVIIVIVKYNLNLIPESMGFARLAGATYYDINIYIDALMGCDYPPTNNRFNHKVVICLKEVPFQPYPIEVVFILVPAIISKFHVH